jgi:hypothetical protein
MKSLILLASILSAIACGAAQDCSAVFSDGSSACDEPVLASELAGTWCDESGRVCLTATVQGSYTWQSGGCLETGRLTSGLEFTPDSTSAMCYAIDDSLYSGSVDWTDTGLSVFLDGQPEALDLNYLDLSDVNSVCTQYLPDP